MRFRGAGTADLAQLETLLTANQLPPEGVAEHIGDFVVAEDHGRIQGAIGLERYGAYGLLRSAVVAPRARGSGVGTRLVTELIARAKVSGVDELYLLTTTAEKYFPRFGFERATRADVPAAVKQSVEFRGACPDTAIVMRRVLNETHQ